MLAVSRRDEVQYAFGDFKGEVADEIKKGCLGGLFLCCGTFHEKRHLRCVVRIYRDDDDGGRSSWDESVLGASRRSLQLRMWGCRFLQQS